MKQFCFAALYLTLLFSILQQANSQSLDCGWVEDPNNGTPEDLSLGCFDVQQVLANCPPVYIRVNFHFFTDTDCDGTLQVTGNAQETAYAAAENLLNDCNSVFPNNQIQLNSPGAVYVCNPLRYVLAGVYIHCLSNANGGSVNFLQSNYGVNTDSELNVFVAVIPGTITGWGYPKMASIDWMNSGNLNHEIGHVFTLKHSWLMFDDCSDTPPIVHTWDMNCNGIISGSESNLQCWIQLDDNTDISYSDRNQNMAHDCMESAPCTDSPCCDPAFINNNVMSYNAYTNAYTSCQLGKMLSDLAVNDCGFLAGIGGNCPPPSAFISRTPLDILQTEDCVGCLILSASYNDDNYQFKIFELAGTQEILVHNPGWKPGPAKNYCFSTDHQFQHTLKPSTNYKATLTVKNTCDEEDFYEYLFTSPGAADCEDDNPDDPPGGGTGPGLIPNPTSGMVQLQFEGFENEVFNGWISSSLMANPLMLFTNHTAIGGLNTIDIDLSNQNPGSYSIVILGQHHLYQAHLVKF